MKGLWKDYGYYVCYSPICAVCNSASCAKNALEVMCLDTFFVILEANKYISEAVMSNFSVFVRSVVHGL